MGCFVRQLTSVGKKASFQLEAGVKNNAVFKSIGFEFLSAKELLQRVKLCLVGVMKGWMDEI